MLSGNLPSSCHFLRASSSQPDANNTITIEVYSLEIPDRVCADQLTPFSATVPLGSYPEGNYTIKVNDQVLGEFNR